MDVVGMQFDWVSYLLRSIVDTFEHLTEWTFANAFLLRENQLGIDFLQNERKIENSILVKFH